MSPHLPYTVDDVVGDSAAVRTPSERGKENDASPGVQSVDRALTTLEVLARLGEAGATEIAGALGVNKSNASRLLVTLRQHRLVEPSGGRGRYRLGVGLLRLAAATSARLDLVQEARPICRQLAAETGETVNVAVLSESSALYLDQVAGSSALQLHNWVGRLLPLQTTSNGKVLLGGLDARGLDRVLGRKDRLREEVDRVREQGYATAVDELEAGLTAAAAPIRDAHGDVVASMSVSGPTFRLTADRIGEVVRLLVTAADEVSSRLGWGEG